MDNSTVHWSQEISLLLDAIFEAAEVSVASCIFVSIFAQVEVLFLPKYSPELNPCENVFGMVKTFIRNERGRGHFVHELVRAFQSVTWEKVRASYRSCVQLWLRIQQPDPCTVCNCFKKEILPKTNFFPYEKSALAALEKNFCFCRAFSIFEHKFLFVPIPTGQFVVPQL